MAEYTIFGAGDPAGISASGDTSAINVASAFNVTAAGKRARRARIFIPAGTTGISGTHKAFLFTGDGADPATPTTQVATVNFPAAPTAGLWNEVEFPEPIELTEDAKYWVSVYLPNGRYGFIADLFTAGPVESVDADFLFAAGNDDVLPGNGSYIYGSEGAAPTQGAGADWYGVDIVIDDGEESGADAGELVDAIGITDSVVAERSGLPTTIEATATATDPLTLDDVAAQDLPVGGANGVRAVRASMMGTRIAWGSAIDTTVQGPVFTQEPAGALTLGVPFTVKWPCRIPAIRIYKAPDLAGTVPVALWNAGGTALASTTVEWVADEGGWREIEFSSPPLLAPGTTYTASYASPDGHYAYSLWVYNAQPTVASPFTVANFTDGGTGGAAFRVGAGHLLPTGRSGHNYYVDVVAEWDLNTPGYDFGTDYFDQWTNGGSSFTFPVGVFYADPEFLEDYASIGVNTLVAGFSSAAYDAAIKASGMDWWPQSSEGALENTRAAVEDPDLGERIKGYLVVDEPDLIAAPNGTYRSPALIREWINAIRRVDSTRPIALNLGKWPTINQGFAWLPVGATPAQVNEDWERFAALPDLLSCDFYNMTDDGSEGRYGIWTYPRITRRMRELSQGRVPVWGYVETTSPTPDQPTPTQVYRASWAHLIEGARGIVFFDHRFADSDVTQDFAALLHDPPMRAQVEDLAALLQTLGPALHAADAGLVTAIESSGTLAANKGGIAAGAKIPMHFTTRAAGGTRYLFAMAIRPGSTTATFTVPESAGETLTVIGEARTVTPDGSGVFSDDFDDGDYTVRLYSWES